MRYQWTPDEVDALDPEFIDHLLAYQTAQAEIDARERERAERESKRKKTMNSAALELLIQLKDEASAGIGNIGSALSSIGGIAVAGVAVAGAALGGFLASSIAGASEAQDALAQLEAVVKSTGGAAGMSVDSLSAYADAMQKTTKFNAEAVMGAESILLTFTGIGKEVFPTATGTVLDLAQAMGTDAKSAAMMVGKAINDPIKGVTALTRVGVTFTEQQIKQIEVMTKSGDTIGAQKVLLDELAKEFGGSAVAAGQTFSGQMEIAKNAIGDLTDSVGEALLPVITPLISRFAVFAQDALPKVQAAIGPVIESFVGFVNTLVTVGEYIGAVIDDGDYLNDFLSNLPAPIRPIVQAFGEAVAALKTFGDYMGAVIEDGDYLNDFLGNLPAPLQPLARGIGEAVSAFQTFGQYMGAVVDDGDYLNDFLTNLPAPLQPMAQAFGEAFVGIQTTIGEVISWVVTNGPTILTTLGTVIGTIVSTVLPILIEGFNGLLGVVGFIVDAFIANWPMIQTVITGVINALVTTVLPALGTALGGLVSVAKTIVASFIENWPMIQATVAGVINAIVTTVLPALIAGFNSIVTVVGVIVAAFIANWPMIQATITAAISAIVTNVLPILIAGLTGIIAIGTQIVSWFIANWPLIQATVTRVIQAVSNVIQVALPIILGIFQTVFPIIQSVVEFAINAVLTVITTVMQLITGNTQGALETIRALWQSVWDRIKGALQSAMDAIKGVITTGMNSAKSEIMRILNEAYEFIRTFPDKFATVGGEIVRGLWSGIQAMGGWFKEMFGAFLQSIIPGWAKSILDINSPSKVMADQVGVGIPEGIMLGIEREAPRLKATMSNLLNQITPPNIAGRFDMNGIGDMTPAFAGMGGSVVINVYAEVSDDVDIDRLAYEIAGRVQTRRSR